MKKGFTLIELLAVIVVLAIIALIAVPVVLNIINDSKESSLLRSAEFYLSAVDYTIANAFLYSVGLENGDYPITPEGDICKKALPCDTDNILKVEVSGDKPTGGIITIDGGTISGVNITLGGKSIIKNKEGKLVYTICKLISGDKNTVGSKYECEVKPGTKFNFYVLSTESDGTTNLILDRNICEDGSLLEEGKTCYVAWALNYDSNPTTYGPITAMPYLNNATSSWSNIPNLNITYNDVNGNFANFKVTGKARLPYKGEVASFNGSNGFLYEYLSGENWKFDEATKPTKIISKAYGYWTFDTSDEWEVYDVSYNGIVGTHYDNVVYDNVFGVRPVINIEL